MTREDLARAWLGLASEAVDPEPAPFYRFMCAWIAFNALYASRHPTVKGERNQVHAFAKERKPVAQHTNLLGADNEYRRSITLIKEPGVFDYRDGKYRHIADDLNLKDVLDCTYQIRCNLFHGDKLPDEERDVSLCKAGLKIISEIIKACI